MPPLVGRLRDVVRGNEYEFEIHDLRSPLFVGGIPQSTYDLRVTSPSGLQVFPTATATSRLSVGSELVAIDVHLERMGSIHITFPETGMHSSFDGAIVVEIVDERGGSSYVDFVRAPFHFSGVPQGKYRLKCTGLGIPTSECVIDVLGGQANEWRIEF
ncbi:MAG: hypothetical protein IPK67_03850 [Planctomycetes bacterium]|nr:hypothetical protein [Planctomycetota bacterium]